MNSNKTFTINELTEIMNKILYKDWVKVSKLGFIDSPIRRKHDICEEFSEQILGVLYGYFKLEEVNE